jgi:hypothetical protein
MQWTYNEEVYTETGNVFVDDKLLENCDTDLCVVVAESRERL